MNDINIVRGDIVYFDKNAFLKAKDQSNGSQLIFQDYKIYSRMCCPAIMGQGVQNNKNNYFLVIKTDKTITNNILYKLYGMHNTLSGISVFYITSNDLNYICKL